MHRLLVAMQTQTPAPAPWTPDGGIFRGLIAFAIVIALIGLLGWLVRRGTFGLTGGAKRTGIAIDATLPLGERRSLMVVSIEGRRLLLGLTQMQVTLITELQAPPRTFDSTLDHSIATPPGSPK